MKIRMNVVKGQADFCGHLDPAQQNQEGKKQTQPVSFPIVTNEVMRRPIAVHFGAGDDGDASCNESVV